MGVFIGPLIQPNQFQFFGHDRTSVAASHAPQLQAQADIFRHCAPGQERKLLKNHSDAVAAQTAQGAFIAAGNIDDTARVVE